MYDNPAGKVLAFAGPASLPATGGNELLIAASILTTVIGLTIVVTTAVRQAAKKDLSV